MPSRKTTSAVTLPAKSPERAKDRASSDAVDRDEPKRREARRVGTDRVRARAEPGAFVSTTATNVFGSDGSGSDSATSPPRVEHYTQRVPPAILDDEAIEFLKRYDAVSVPRGPDRSELAMPEDGVVLDAEELWVRMKGWTPIEFLTYVYRQPFINITHRIRAAESLLDFIHRRKAKRFANDETSPLLPKGFVSASGLGALDLSRLDDKQLSQLEALLSVAKVDE